MGLYVPTFTLGYLSINHDFPFGTLIWKASMTYKDTKFCKELKAIIVVDIWLNSLRKRKPRPVIILYLYIFALVYTAITRKYRLANA